MKPNGSYEVRVLSGKIAAASRDRKPELAEKYRAQLRAVKLAEHAERVVADAPELTPEQVDRISAILNRGRKARA